MRQNEPLYVISVAARLLELHPQTLRKYEREGFVAPSRTTGNLRLYSSEDLELLRQVKYLVDRRGINLAGVQLALDVTKRLQKLQKQLEKQLASEDGRQSSTAQRTLSEVEATLEVLGIPRKR